MSLEWTVEDMVNATGGKLLSSPIKSFCGIGTDTRVKLDGQIFVALKGDQFDAHKFLPDAVAAGASALIVHSQTDSLANYFEDITVIRVEDTLEALQDMAIFWRKKLTAQVIAISGSAGKTTTKEFLATILSENYKTHYSRGSYNNHWGVPLTLLAAPLNSEKIVVEMGMNNPGEITRLCEIARPDVCMLTMVGTAHIGQFSSQKSLAKAKEELYEACPKAIQVFNLDNEFTLDMFRRRSNSLLPERVLGFSSFQEDVNVKLRITDMELGRVKVSGDIDGVYGKVEIPIFGRQNIVNIMGASALALAANMTPAEIWAALPNCRTVWGRSQMVSLKCGAKALFDGYNANPESMAALIKSIFETPIEGQKMAVLGEMLELGEHAGESHRGLGEMVGNSDIDLVWFIGPHSKEFGEGIEASMFSKTCYLSDTYEQGLAKKIGSMLNQKDIVVLKGSRGMKLEQVLQNWDPLDF